jgi:lipoate synthase
LSHAFLHKALARLQTPSPQGQRTCEERSDAAIPRQVPSIIGIASSLQSSQRQMRQRRLYFICSEAKPMAASICWPRPCSIIILMKN